MYTVSVLLSTYNGEKYIEKLIRSVLGQANVEVKLIIRDDGSTDSTVEIIRNFKDSRISLYLGRNIGPAKSFLRLLKKAPITDYYAFCDQDDIWYENKLIWAIEKLSEYEEADPLLYMSTYDVVDQDGNFLYKRDLDFGVPFTLPQTVISRCPNGCMMVFNKTLALIMKNSRFRYARMHDIWTLLTAEALHAKIITDDRATLKWRLHDTNTVGTNISKRIRIKRLLESALYRKNERMLQAKSVYEEYQDLLPEDTKQLLLKVICYKKSFRNRIALAADKRFRYDKWSNILFVSSVLLGFF